jgi:hypothetical protein
MGPAADTFSHKLGLALLGAEGLQSTYALAFNMPLGPWLGFNNTVVAGSLAMGLYIAYPVYWTSGLLCSWLRPLAAERLSRRGLRGAPSDSEHNPASRAAA